MTVNAEHYLKGLLTVAIAIFVSFEIAQAQDVAPTQDANQNTPQNGDVVEVVNESEDHTIFASLLEETELDDLLKEEGPYTVLAPTDEAFENLDNFDEIQQDSERLQTVVIGHLYNDKIESSDVENAKNVDIQEGDIEASNGVVHVVDEVLTNE